MSDQPNPTGELDYVDFYDLDLEQAQEMAKRINAALNAERENGFREAAQIYKPARDDDRAEIQQLREQLSAEREKVHGIQK